VIRAQSGKLDLCPGDIFVDMTTDSSLDRALETPADGIAASLRSFDWRSMLFTIAA
jgi:hypothetical protein